MAGQDGMPAAGPSRAASIFAALAGLVAGAVIGFGIGLVAGLGIAAVTSMSCFEGACSYFAVFLALVGLLVGAIAGAILAFRLVRRRRRDAQSA